MSKFSVIANFFVLVAITAIYAFASTSASAAPVPAQAQVLPSKVAPTKTATPTQTQAPTATPEPTQTPEPVVQKIVVVQVTPTSDIEYIKALDAAKNDARLKELEVQRQQTEIDSARADIMTRQLVTGLAGLFAAVVMVVGLFAIANAYIVSWLATPKKQAKTEEHVDSNALSEFPPCSAVVFKDWLKKADGYIAPPAEVSELAFGSQSKWRDVRNWLRANGYIIRTDKGLEFTQAFYEWVEQLPSLK